MRFALLQRSSLSDLLGRLIVRTVEKYLSAVNLMSPVGWRLIRGVHGPVLACSDHDLL